MRPRSADPLGRTAPKYNDPTVSSAAKLRTSIRMSTDPAEVARPPSSLSRSTGRRPSLVLDQVRSHTPQPQPHRRASISSLYGRETGTAKLGAPQRSATTSTLTKPPSALGTRYGLSSTGRPPMARVGSVPTNVFKGDDVDRLSTVESIDELVPPVTSFKVLIHQRQFKIIDKEATGADPAFAVGSHPGSLRLQLALGSKADEHAQAAALLQKSEGWTPERHDAVINARPIATPAEAVTKLFVHDFDDTRSSPQNTFYISQGVAGTDQAELQGAYEDLLLSHIAHAPAVALFVVASTPKSLFDVVSSQFISSWAEDDYLGGAGGLLFCGNWSVAIKQILAQLREQASDAGVYETITILNPFYGDLEVLRHICEPLIQDPGQFAQKWNLEPHLADTFHFVAHITRRSIFRNDLADDKGLWGSHVSVLLNSSTVVPHWFTVLASIDPSRVGYTLVSRFRSICAEQVGSQAVASLLMFSPKVYLGLTLSPKTDLQSVKQNIDTLGCWFTELRHNTLVRRPKRYRLAESYQTVNDLTHEVRRLKTALWTKQPPRLFDGDAASQVGLSPGFKSATGTDQSFDQSLPSVGQE